MSTYHEVHYAMFHKVLPGLLFREKEFRDQVLEAGQNGQLQTMLAAIWDGIAERAVAEFGGDNDLIDVGPRSFSPVASRGPDGRVALVIETPQVRGRVQASAVVALFDESTSDSLLRYFTCEAPSQSGQPWMVGEWSADGSRHNLGVISDPTPSGLLKFVGSKTGFVPTTDRRPARPRHADITVRELPDVDALLNERLGPENVRGSDSPRSRNLGGKGPRIGGEVAQTTSHDPHGSPIPVVAGPISFSSSWSSEPPVLASDALMNLYRLANAGGSAMVMTTKKTKGLAKRTSSYVQFMWNDDRSLIVEIQGDYSYWGVSVLSSSWPLLERCGLSIPTGGVGNFGRIVPASSSHEDRLQALTDVFGAFVTVIQPTGKIIPSVVGLPR